MIQIGILELIIVVLVILFSVKPEKLMHYIKSIFSLFLQIQNFFTSTKEDIERELNIQHKIDFNTSIRSPMEFYENAVKYNIRRRRIR